MRPAVVAAVAIAWAAAAVPATPFARSGERVRSGYELVRTVSSAGIVEGPLGRLAVVALAVLPVLAAGALVAASLRGARGVATLAAMAGIVAGGAGVAVLVAPVRSSFGAPLAVAVGAAALAVAALAWREPR